MTEVILKVQQSKGVECQRFLETYWKMSMLKGLATTKQNLHFADVFIVFDYIFPNRSNISIED
jgi:hypothetical protein